LSLKERKLAEREVTLLKILKAPTIIRYYDSFIENDSLCIAMEYAPLGSLHDKIQDCKSRGLTISEDEALYFIA